MKMDQKERMRKLLCDLQHALREEICARRDEDAQGALAAVAAESIADTIYLVDKITEERILAWFAENWPREWPVELVMEGAEEHGPLVFPEGVPAERIQWTCLLDPIDGTRNLMYDKRPAWALAGIAPRKDGGSTLADLEVAAMTELPPSRHWRADQLSAVRGRGLVAEALDLRSGEVFSFSPVPSRATDCRHGFASIARFFPDGLESLGALEEALWKRLYPEGAGRSPLVFNDQYLTTGGQLYEMVLGRDRFLADLRPLVLPRLGLGGALCCHPYDLAALLVAEEAGVIVEDPLHGGKLSAPMDTTTSVAWAAYANEAIADHVRPALRDVLAKFPLS